MTEDSIGLSGSDRLDRIEKLLEKIDGKLEAKVDRADFVALELRVRDIELHGSSGLQATIHDVNEIKTQAKSDAEAIRDQVIGVRAQAKTDADTIREQVASVQRKLAYATGTVSAVIILVNILIALHHGGGF